MGSARAERYKRQIIDIPDSARTVKAIFWTEPNRAKQLEIKQFIIATGKPYLHPEVTHTKPPQGATVRYLEKFDLPPRFAKNPDLWCPCPICTPELPHFKEDGIISWWPDEAVIRVIGGDCFRSLNPEGHEEAARLYANEVKRRKNESYLLSKLWIVPLLRHDVSAWMPIAEALDGVRNELLHALLEHSIPLWKNVRNGRLLTEQRVRVFTQGKGHHTHRTQHHLYATIRGARFVDPRAGETAGKLRMIEIALSRIDFGSRPQNSVLQMTESDRLQTAALLRGVLKEMTAARRLLDEWRRFLSTETLATLRTWSALPEAACPFYFDFGASLLRIGRSSLVASRIAVPPKAFEPLTDMPTAASDAD